MIVHCAHIRLFYVKLFCHFEANMRIQYVRCCISSKFKNTIVGRIYAHIARQKPNFELSWRLLVTRNKYIVDIYKHYALSPCGDISITNLNICNASIRKYLNKLCISFVKFIRNERIQITKKMYKYHQGKPLNDICWFMIYIF